MRTKQPKASDLEKLSGVCALTRLLALNTMLEAARAGKEARGFASVAGEISDIARNNGRSGSRQIFGDHNDIGLDQDDLDMAVHEQLSAMDELNTSLLIQGNNDGSRHHTTRELNHMYQLLCQDQGKDSA